MLVLHINFCYLDSHAGQNLTFSMEILCLFSIQNVCIGSRFPSMVNMLSYLMHGYWSHLEVRTRKTTYQPNQLIIWPKLKFLLSVLTYIVNICIITFFYTHILRFGLWYIDIYILTYFCKNTVCGILTYILTFFCKNIQVLIDPIVVISSIITFIPKK